jgi:hypothetical protein
MHIGQRIYCVLPPPPIYSYQQAAQAQQQAQAQAQAGLNNYDRVYAACMQGCRYQVR